MRFRISESAVISATKSKVDRTNGIIRNVKILGPVSKNGRRYTSDCIEKAAPLYEGVRVFVNHPNNAERDRSAIIDRPIGDRWGFIESPAAKKQSGQTGLFGNLRFNPKHALTETLLWSIDNEPQSVCLSHIADGKWMMEGNERVVTEIEKVWSVDLVDRGATTNSLFESLDDPDERKLVMDLSKLTVDELKKERPELFESIGRDAIEKYKSGRADRLKIIDQACDEFKLAREFRSGPVFESLETCAESQIKPIVKQLAESFSGGRNKGRGEIRSDESNAGSDRLGGFGGGDDDDDFGFNLKESEEYWEGERRGSFV